MINTIDMTTMLPRTVEAADLQGRELSQSQHAAEQTAVQFKKETEQAARQPVETKKSETQEKDMDDSESEKRKKKRQLKKRKKMEKEAPMAPRSDSSFDIMI